MTCKDNCSVQCMWNDGVRFIGGDMKGDDRHGTRQESASGCREKCDGTEGCNYWSWRRSGAGMNCWLKQEKQEEVRETIFISGSISSVCIVTRCTNQWDNQKTTIYKIKSKQRKSCHCGSNYQNTIH